MSLSSGRDWPTSPLMAAGACSDELDVPSAGPLKGPDNAVSSFSMLLSCSLLTAGD